MHAETTPAAVPAPLPVKLAEKHRRLVDYLAACESAITAFSGGIDSSVVAYLAHRVLGARALAVTSSSESLSRDDLELACRLARDWGMAHRVIKTSETQNPDYLANPVNRCYFCKSTLYEDLARLAGAESYATVLNGTNTDDLGDHRPGLQAATEYGVRSPLAELGFHKREIRTLAAHLGLPNHDKPQSACLSSRVPYGLSISLPVLGRIEKAERYLRSLGIGQLRVRHHDDVARIEVPVEAFPRVLEQRESIERTLREYGYRYVTLDLRGFRSGSLNEGLASKS